MKNRHLREIELTVLRATAEELPERACKILKKQVSETNLVQRHEGGREVNLYRRRLRVWPGEYSVFFPNQSEELALARVDLESEAGPVTATVWAVRGHVFTIRFSHSVTATVPVIVRNQCLLENPLIGPDDRHPGEEPDPSAISLLLHVPTEEIHSSKPPLERIRRQLRLELLACGPPADWLQLLRIADGFRVGSATVHGLVGLPTVPLPEDSTVHVLAEGIDDCFLGLLCGRGGARLVALCHEGIVLEEYEGCFSEALHSYLGRLGS